MHIIHYIIYALDFTLTEPRIMQTEVSFDRLQRFSFLAYTKSEGDHSHLDRK